MQIVNVPKLIVAVTAMICITALTMTDKISPEAAVAVISSILAYILGNGVAARAGKTVTPIIGRRDPTDPPTDYAP